MAFNNSDQGYHSLPSSLSSSPIQPTSSGALSSEKMPLYHRDVIYNSQPSSSTPSPTSSNEQFHFVQAVLPPPQNYQFYDNLIIEPESRNYSNKRRYVRNAVPRCVTNNNRPSNANVPDENNIGEKEKRLRTSFTSDQLMRMEKEFAISPYLCRVKRVELSSSLVLSENQIKIWYQNRRMKAKMQSTAAKLKHSILKHNSCKSSRASKMMGGACHLSQGNAFGNVMFVNGVQQQFQQQQFHQPQFQQQQFQQPQLQQQQFQQPQLQQHQFQQQQLQQPQFQQQQLQHPQFQQHQFQQQQLQHPQLQQHQFQQQQMNYYQNQSQNNRQQQYQQRKMKKMSAGKRNVCQQSQQVPVVNIKFANAVRQQQQQVQQQLKNKNAVYNQCVAVPVANYHHQQVPVVNMMFPNAVQQQQQQQQMKNKNVVYNQYVSVPVANYHHQQVHMTFPDAVQQQQQLNNKNAVYNQFVPTADSCQQIPVANMMFDDAVKQQQLEDVNQCISNDASNVKDKSILKKAIHKILVAKCVKSLEKSSTDDVQQQPKDVNNQCVSNAAPIDDSYLPSAEFNLIMDEDIVEILGADNMTSSAKLFVGMIADDFQQKKMDQSPGNSSNSFNNQEQISQYQDIIEIISNDSQLSPTCSDENGINADCIQQQVNYNYSGENSSICNKFMNSKKEVLDDIHDFLHFN
ncbi:putative mediator of RNA polymerase II transcription subunit 26 [Leptopilina boulardi]|uniref:putative mediator of RNA polymerase II transcription subunit 26 n=1 Tax=Leptopilina boulardi TaxID=63433 RepID=UPI0021F57577|nr:putative mediator of RNA polymerase II transcription subunit 26 [Leptopilina boulardi]